MSKKNTYSNYDIEKLKKNLREMYKIFFEEILKDSKYDNFLCKESFEKHEGQISIMRNNMNRLSDFIKEMENENE